VSLYAASHAPSIMNTHLDNSMWFASRVQ